MTDPIILDGKYGEGGGQIVRTALALSTLTGQPFEVSDIRIGRKEPGLKAQHLHAVLGVQKLCGAVAEGAELGSTQLRFTPGKMAGSTISIDIGTAGSVTLLLQALLLPSCFAGEKVRLKITGGTDTLWSMPYDYFMQILFPFFQRFARITCDLNRRGFYPKGGGKIDMVIKSKFSAHASETREAFLQALRAEFPPIEIIESGKLTRISGVSFASRDLKKAEVAERQATGAKHGLNTIRAPIKIRAEYDDTRSTGSGIVLFAFRTGEVSGKELPATIGADALGEKGKRAEIVGAEAAQALRDALQSDAPIDPRLADNLIPLIGLLGGKLWTSKITPHIQANIYVTEKFLGEPFKVEETDTGAFIGIDRISSEMN